MYMYTCLSYNTMYRFVSDFTVFTAAGGCMGKFMWFLFYTCIINRSRVADIPIIAVHLYM